MYMSFIKVHIYERSPYNIDPMFIISIIIVVVPMLWICEVYPFQTSQKTYA